MALTHLKPAARRAQRVRTRLKSLANGRPRLSVHRSSKNIYAQVIDDVRGVTLAHASTLEDKAVKGSDKDAAARVGALIAQRAIEKGVKDVVFDRGSFIYHGRVKALADAGGSVLVRAFLTLFLERRGVGQGDAARVVDHLGVDVLGRAEHRQARTPGAHLLQTKAHAGRAALGGFAFGKRHGDYFFLPSLRRTCSPA